MEAVVFRDHAEFDGRGRAQIGLQGKQVAKGVGLGEIQILGSQDIAFDRPVFILQQDIFQAGNPRFRDKGYGEIKLIAIGQLCNQRIQHFCLLCAVIGYNAGNIP